MDAFSAIAALVVVVPMLAALVCALAGLVWRGVVAPLTTAALAFSCAGSIALLVRVHETGEAVHHHFGGWPVPKGIVYSVDRLNGIVLVMISAVAFLVSIWMRPTLRHEIRPPAQRAYHAVVLLFTAGMLGITITGDVFNLYVFLEIASITSYVLVAMGRRRQALYAGFTYLIVGSIGATFILLGIGHLYQTTGTLAMSDLLVRVPAAYALHPSAVQTAFAFFTVGLAIKMALFPLHGWQPGAYTHAPSSASVLLAATATKVGAYALYRIAFGVFGVAFLGAAIHSVKAGLLVTAASAIVVGPLIAVRQDDLKRLLAYSSVGQIGYIVLGLVLLNVDGLTGSLIHFWNHAAAKGALFCAAGVLVYGTGRARVQDLAGLGQRAPWTGAVLTVAGCSLVGVPLTGGFLSKYYLAIGALDEGHVFLVPVLLLSSILTAVYVWRILQLVWFTPAGARPAVSSDVPWAMRGPSLILAGACLVFGLTPVSVDVARAAAEVLLR